MPGWFWTVLAVSVVGEVVAVWIVLQRVRAGQGSLADLDLGVVRELSSGIEQCVTEYMAANFAGDPTQLPDTLRILLPRVRELIRASGVTLDERAVRLLLTNAVATHKVARRGDVIRALDAIPTPDHADAA